MQERKGYSMNSYFMGLKQEEGGGHIMDKGVFAAAGGRSFCICFHE